MKTENSKLGGFTLVEILVVILIMLLLLSLGINTYQNQRKQVIYNESVSKVLSLIKTARDYALTQRPVFDETKDAGEENYVPREGYGVYIERSDIPGASRIILFANTITENDEERNQYDEGDIIEEEYLLEPTVNFKGLWKDRELPEPSPIDAGTPNQAVVIFRPPLSDASMAVNDNPAEGGLIPLEDLYLEFRKQESHPDIPSQYIHLNRISGIAEISR